MSEKNKATFIIHVQFRRNATWQGTIQWVESQKQQSFRSTLEMLRLIDEDAKAFEPLRKYLALPKDDPARAEHMDSALRVACFIPTEVMYTAAQTAETLRSLADKGVKGAVSDVGVGLELCRAAMRASRLNILINAAGMTDEVFAMTLRRECELVFEQYGPVIDAGLAAVEARIG